MPTMMIRFEGLCCHIDPQGVIAVGRRAVLCDATAHDHQSYIEVFPSYFNAADNSDFTFTPTYMRDNVPYRRTEVRNVKIQFLNPILSPPLAVLSSFDQRIPKLSKVERRFEDLNPAFLQPQIPTGTVGAYFDMSNGVLSAGPPEAFSTEFVPLNDWPKTNLGEWVQLELEIDTTNAPPTLRVTDLNGGGFRDLKLTPSADMVTFGNQLEDDILGIPVPPTGRPSHFGTYWDMSAVPFVNPLPPQPRRGLGLGIGCSNSSYP